MSTSRKSRKQMNVIENEMVFSDATSSSHKEYTPNPDHVLELRTLSGSTFKNLFDTLKAVLNEANIIFTKSGLKLSAIDTNHDAIVHLFMDASAFEFYYCGEEKIVIGLDIDLIQRNVRTNKNNDLMCWVLHKDRRNYLEISFENQQKGTSVLDKLSLRTLPETQITDELHYPVPTEMESLTFQNICREMSSFGATKIQIETVGNSLIFSNLNGEPKRRQTVKIKENEKDIVVPPPQKGVFLLSYLKPFAKAANLSQKVRIYLATNKPLALAYAVDNLGTLKYLLTSERNEDDSDSEDESSEKERELIQEESDEELEEEEVIPVVLAKPKPVTVRKRKPVTKKTV